MRNCAVMQPTFNPWLGYFDLIDQSDVFVLYDDVQLVKQSWQVRNRIKTANGELFLSIPYLKTDNWRQLLINSAATNESLLWRSKHIKSIENSYRRSVFFDEIFAFVKALYEPEYNTISSFNSNMIRQVALKIGINTVIVNSSSMEHTDGTKDLRLANMCMLLNADTYLSPQGSADYIEKYSQGGEIAKAGIDVFYHDYKHPEYPQINGGFLPYMGIIDLLFNVGFQNSLAVIRSGRKPSIHYTLFEKSNIN